MFIFLFEIMPVGFILLDLLMELLKVFLGRRDCCHPFSDQSGPLALPVLLGLLGLDVLDTRLAAISEGHGVRMVSR